MTVLPDSDEHSLVGGARSGFHLGPFEDFGIDESYAVLRVLIGKQFGIVQDCLPVETVIDESNRTRRQPMIHTYTARGPRRVGVHEFPYRAVGTGIAIESKIAKVKAIAEVVERYCSLVPCSSEQLIRGSFNDVIMQDRTIPPSSFALLSESQYQKWPNLKALTNTKVIDWRRAYSLTYETSTLVPAGLVHFDCVSREPNNYLPDLCSSGYACHPSVHECILRGLCEVLERDALVIAWRRRLPLVPIEIAGSCVGRFVSRYFWQIPWDLSLFRIPSDSPFPVVVCLASSATHYPHAALGSACAPSAGAAARKALLEAYQMLHRSRSANQWSEALGGIPRDLDQRASLYAEKAGAERLFRTIRRHSSPIHIQELEGSFSASACSPDLLGWGIDALAEAGREVLVADVTTPDVATSNIWVVRVIIPGALDICIDSRFPRLGGRRLYQVPEKLGLRCLNTTDSNLNLLPVPLA